MPAERLDQRPRLADQPRLGRGHQDERGARAAQQRRLHGADAGARARTLSVSMARTKSPTSRTSPMPVKRSRPRSTASSTKCASREPAAGQDGGRILQDGEGARVEQREEPARRVEEVDGVARRRRVDDERGRSRPRRRAGRRCSTAMYSAVPASDPERFW